MNSYVIMEQIPYVTKYLRGKTFAVFVDLTQPRMFSREYFLPNFSQIISHQGVSGADYGLI